MQQIGKDPYQEYLKSGGVGMNPITGTGGPQPANTPATAAPATAAPATAAPATQGFTPGGANDPRAAMGGQPQQAGAQPPQQTNWGQPPQTQHPQPPAQGHTDMRWRGNDQANNQIRNDIASNPSQARTMPWRGGPQQQNMQQNMQQAGQQIMNHPTMTMQQKQAAMFKMQQQMAQVHGRPQYGGQTRPNQGQTQRALQKYNDFTQRGNPTASKFNLQKNHMNTWQQRMAGGMRGNPQPANNQPMQGQAVGSPTPAQNGRGLMQARY